MNRTVLQRVEATYNRIRDEYDENITMLPFYINGYALFGKILDRVLNGRRFDKILDIGCGPGVQTVRLARHGDVVVGVDIADDLLAVAKERCRDYAHVQFIKEDARALSFESAAFDAVFSYGDVLSHIVEGYELALAEMSRVAKPGALVTFEVDNKWHLGIFYRPDEFIQNLMNPGRGHTARKWAGLSFKTFTCRELRKLLEKHDLELVEYHGSNILSSVIPDRYTLERGRRSFLGRVALGMGRMDLVVSRRFPFNRLGFNSLVIAVKR